MQFNDCIAAPDGSFLAGTFYPASIHGFQKKGKLYRFFPDGNIEIIFSLTGSGGRSYQGSMIEVATFDKINDTLSYKTLYEEDSSDTYFWISWLKAMDHDGDGDLDILADNKSQGLILEQDESGSFRIITDNKKNW